MAYQSCPKCNSPNRQVDSKCYSCGTPLRKPQSVAKTPAATTEGPAWLMFFLGVGLSVSLGAGLGFAVEFAELDIPFFWEELLLGLVCSLAAAFSIAKFKEMPEHQILRKLGPAALLGSIVGVCLYAVWSGFEPEFSLVVLGAAGGLCAGIPIAVSFGLLGGEAKGLGWREFANIVAGATIGLFIGCAFSDGPGMVTGYIGIGGLIPCLAAGRIDALTLLIMVAMHEGNRDYDDYDY